MSRHCHRCRRSNLDGFLGQSRDPQELPKHRGTLRVSLMLLQRRPSRRVRRWVSGRSSRRDSLRVFQARRFWTWGLRRCLRRPIRRRGGGAELGIFWSPSGREQPLLTPPSVEVEFSEAVGFVCSEVSLPCAEDSSGAGVVVACFSALGDFSSVWEVVVASAEGVSASFSPEQAPSVKTRPRALTLATTFSILRCFIVCVPSRGESVSERIP